MVLMISPLPARAHQEAGTLGETEFITLLTLGCAALVYGLRVRTLWRHPHTAHRLPLWRVLCFVLALGALGAALIGPLDTLAVTSLSMHMFQHMLLMAVAAPLLALGAPMAPLLRNSPPVVRRWLLGRAAVLARPFIAFLLHGLAVWFWHAPGPYEAALAHQGVHVLEHGSFLLTGLLFWYSLLHAGRTAAAHHGAGAFWSLATVMHSGLLGALLTFATTPLYPSYRHAPPFGWTPLEDQQLAGLVMWIPAGLVYVAAGLYSMTAWLRAVEAGARQGALPSRRNSTGLVLHPQTHKGHDLKPLLQWGNARVKERQNGGISCHDRS
jgi:putative membrane protein